MSGAMRVKAQADFDMERFVDLFDEAMTSSDPRVIETLRKLMMIVALTRPEDRSHIIDRRTGPLRQMYEDVRSCHRRISDLEDEFTMSKNHIAPQEQNYQAVAQQSKYSQGVISGANGTKGLVNERYNDA